MFWQILEALQKGRGEEGRGKEGRGRVEMCLAYVIVGEFPAEGGVVGLENQP